MMGFVIATILVVNMSFPFQLLQLFQFLLDTLKEQFVNIGVESIISLMLILLLVQELKLSLMIFSKL